jgi:hypothetical protein
MQQAKFGHVGGEARDVAQVTPVALADLDVGYGHFGRGSGH